MDGVENYEKPWPTIYKQKIKKALQFHLFDLTGSYPPASVC